MVPVVNFRPPFNITRASHIVLEVTDLQRSRDFYTKIVGLVVSDESETACYLRGLSEACHHSLVLIKTTGDVKCRRIGFRVYLDEDLDLAYQWFRDQGLPAEWVKMPYQGRTLNVEDPFGTKIELCAHMEVRDRKYLSFEQFTGAHAQRIDHFQVFSPDCWKSCEFYSSLGFRNSEYLAHGDKLLGAFMFRKGTCLDLAIVENEGPKMHHFAYIIPESHLIFTACDLAGNYGYPGAVDRGPGRHGPGGMLYVYLMDPDGHRIELCDGHYQTIDTEVEPVRWEAGSLSTNVRWGLPATEHWYFHATPFDGAQQIRPEKMPNPQTLEILIQQQLVSKAH
ncbi:MAG: VOC family protein [Pseudomonadota bacterium]